MERSKSEAANSSWTSCSTARDSSGKSFAAFTEPARGATGIAPRERRQLQRLHVGDEIRALLRRQLRGLTVPISAATGPEAICERICAARVHIRRTPRDTEQRRNLEQPSRGHPYGLVV